MAPPAFLVPLITGLLSAGTGVASTLLQKKPPDPMNPVQSGGAEAAPIGGGMNLNPLQKNDPNNQRYGAVTDLLQRGY